MVKKFEEDDAEHAKKGEPSRWDEVDASSYDLPPPIEAPMPGQLQTNQ